MSTEAYPQSHGSLAGLSGTDHHTQYGIWFSGIATSRPTAPYRFGRWYYATDTQQLSLDQGAGWLDLPMLNAPLTWTGANTFQALATFNAGVTVAGPVRLADDARIGSTAGSAGFAMALNQIMSA